MRSSTSGHESKQKRTGINYCRRWNQAAAAARAHRQTEKTGEWPLPRKSGKPLDTTSLRIVPHSTLLEKNITGSTPEELTKLSALVELKLDGNLFSGGIPDFSGCRKLDETVVLAAPAKKLGSYFSEVATAKANRFALSEFEDATDKIVRRIGSGGFGIVYYGKQTREQEPRPDEQHRAWLSPLHRGSLLPREHGR
ncbi:hypothetical protein D1007_32157 [Hordeum vulgare]|nr:hypothetical protein D1007_32157 [Hordeum vulgare]